MLPSAHEHPPSSAVDVSEGDEESFCSPAELALPAGMEMVSFCVCGRRWEVGGT